MGAAFQSGSTTAFWLTSRRSPRSRCGASRASSISWTDSAEVGHGRSSVWVHPSCDLHYKFDGGTPPKLDPALLEEMNIESIQARGIELADATLAHSPRTG